MKQLIKISNQSAKILGIYSNQTTNFYIQDLFQSIFLTGMQHQITQKRI